MVHDLLPVRCPHFFPPDAAGRHAAWLSVVAEADRAICVSRTVADDLSHWIAAHRCERVGNLEICHSHHGSDLVSSVPSKGLPWGASRLLALLSEGPTFLIVGTVEPRKAHAQTLDAFEGLWKSGSQARLVIAGKAGWMVEPLIRRLRSHPERGRRLFWFERASDEFLDRLYSVADCLVMPSHGEGFGLPLIEAASKRVPIIARDLPVFRETAGNNAFYFNGQTGADLQAAILAWMDLSRQGIAPESARIGLLTWSESAERLKMLLLGDGRSIRPAG